MRHQRQPEGSKYCGQACVAMIAGVPLTTVVAKIGKTRRQGTTEPDLRSALRRFGIRLSRFVCHRTSHQLPHPVLARLRWEGRHRGYHWIVLYRGRVFDPVFRSAISLASFERWRVRARAYITSSATAVGA